MSKEDKELCGEVISLLKDNDMYYDVEVSNRLINIRVEDGDWKHDHMALKVIMKTHGYIFIERHIITDTCEDDSFSATYVYKKPD